MYTLTVLSAEQDARRGLVGFHAMCHALSVWPDNALLCIYRDCAKNMDAHLGNERWGLFYVIDRPSVLEVEKQVEI